MKLAGKLFVLGILTSVIVGVGVFTYFSRSLDINEINKKDLAQTTEFYDRTGQVKLYEVFQEENRTVLEQEQMSQFIRDATVAIEDKNFYDHAGFNPSSIIRAVLNNATGGSQQGASTLTQQFIKNRLLSNERTYTRKIKELVLSIQLEKRFSKEEILTLYLNQVAYGGTSYGIEAASVQYFGKSAAELTLAESAMLAALPQSPSVYSPLVGGSSNELLIGRTHFILDQMVEQGYIDQAQADEAKKVDLLALVDGVDRTDAIDSIIAPHFVFEAKAQLEANLGSQLVQQGGLRVITTLDLEAQKIADEEIQEQINAGFGANLDWNGAENTAFSMSDPSNGDVIALVGSRDFNYPGFGAFNAAASYRQPGSSFKPYVYAELFKSKDWGPGSNVWDVETNFTVAPNPPFIPGNADDRFDGQTTIRRALGKSRNIPAVKGIYIAGTDNTVQLVESMGASVQDNGSQLATALGSREVKLMEHVNAYTAFANGGIKHGMNMIVSAETPSGEIVAERVDENERVLDPEIAYLVTDMLADPGPRASLFGNRSPFVFANGINHMALKTGTTNSSKDGWMMAYTPHVVAGIWQGTDKEEGTIGKNYIFNGLALMDIMERYHRDIGELRDFDRPDGIKTVTLDARTGRLATGSSTNKRTDIFPSWYEPRVVDPDAKIVTVDLVSGKLATDCTPEAAKIQSSDSGIVPEISPDDPLFANWAKNTSYRSAASTSGIAGTDDVHNCSDVKPSISLSSAGPDAANAFVLSAQVTQGTFPLDSSRRPSRVIFRVNGEVIDDQPIGGPGTYTTQTAAITSSATFSAQVIDTALYSASDSLSQNISSGSVEITSPSSGASTDPSNTQVTWQAYTGAESYRVCIRPDGGTLSCSVTNGTSTSYVTLDSATDHQVYVEARDDEGSTISGSRSNTVSFTTL